MDTSIEPRRDEPPMPCSKSYPSCSVLDPVRYREDVVKKTLPQDSIIVTLKLPFLRMFFMALAAAEPDRAKCDP